MRCVELFAGCGGLALGGERAGFGHELVVEFNPQASKTLRFNRSWPIYAGDVREVDFRPFRGVDVVSGGPPCQPFSIGGKHRAQDDPRDMFPEAARAVDSIRPRAFLFENVPGLTRATFRPYFRNILDRLAAAGDGYTVSHQLVNAADYGIPQTRRRLFIVGFRRDTGLQWAAPAPTHSRERWVTVRDALRDLPDPETSKRKSPFADHVFQPNAKVYPGHTGSPLDQPAKTLKAGVHGVPGGENMLRRPDGSVRYFSIREAARLQTFPDSWQFYGSWTEAMRQIGNAVPVLLAETMARSVASLMGNANPRRERFAPPRQRAAQHFGARASHPRLLAQQTRETP